MPFMVSDGCRRSRDAAGVAEGQRPAAAHREAAAVGQDQRRVDDRFGRRLTVIVAPLPLLFKVSVLQPLLAISV